MSQLRTAIHTEDSNHSRCLASWYATASCAVRIAIGFASFCVASWNIPAVSLLLLRLLPCSTQGLQDVEGVPMPEVDEQLGPLQQEVR